MCACHTCVRECVPGKGQKRGQIILKYGPKVVEGASTKTRATTDRLASMIGQDHDVIVEVACLSFEHEEDLQSNIV